MKVNKTEDATYIYPFVAPDGDEFEALDAVAVRPDGTVKLIWHGAPVMDAQAARALGEALLHAVAISQNGQK